jgi:hypothetical protein
VRAAPIVASVDAVDCSEGGPAAVRTRRARGRADARARRIGMTGRSTPPASSALEWHGRPSAPLRGGMRRVPQESAVSQTLAQRKALAAGSARAREAAAEALRPELDRFDPVSCEAMRTVHALLRAGARLVDVRRGRVLLCRGEVLCIVDAAGRPDWRGGVS